MSTALWVSVLVISHALAAACLIKALLLAGKGQQNCPDDTVKAGHGAATGNSSPTACDDVTFALDDQGNSQGIASTWNKEAQHLTWEDTGCSYDLRGSTIVVLQGVHGEAYSGQMQALMGPSGAGKSTLMDILAMRKTVGTLTGRLMVNGQPAGRSYIRSTSYVPQEDTFIPTMTCSETLAFYAAVLLPGGGQQRKQQVQEVLREMGLSGSCDTLVGGTLPGGLVVRGMSGGERRRLSISVGVLGSPLVVFLDEPTSGLDSFAALNVMGYLKIMTMLEQKIIIATIHQPRSAIWSMFDTVTLLSSGRLMYHGPCQMMTPWFESLGYKLTTGAESDWVLDLVAVSFDKPLGQLDCTMRTLADVDAASAAFCKAHNKQPATESSAVAPSAWSGTAKASILHTEYPSSWVQQFGALLRRELASITRNPFDVAGRLVTAAWLGLLFGLVFYNMSVTSLDSLRNRVNLLFALAATILLMPLTSISLFTDDKRIHMADTAAKRYRLTAYYAAKLAATTPFSVAVALSYAWIAYGMAGLHSGGEHVAIFGLMMAMCYLISAQMLHLCITIAANQDTAFGLVVMWSAMQTLFSSFFINFNQVTLYGITMLRYISAAYFALEALIVNEFSGSQMSCEAGMDSGTRTLLQNLFTNASAVQRTMLRQLEKPQPGCVINADAIISYFNYHRSFGATLGILLCYLGILHVLTFASLALLARKEAR